MYSDLNKTLRTRDRSVCKKYIPYLKLFLTGLYKCEKVTDSVWRGVNLSADKMKYNEKEKSNNKVIRWYGFTSTSPSMETIKGFIGKDDCTIISMGSIKNGYNISKFNAYGEKEVVFPPSTGFTIVSLLPFENTTIVQLDEAKVKLKIDYLESDMRKLIDSKNEYEISKFNKKNQEEEEKRDEEEHRKDTTGLSSETNNEGKLSSKKTKVILNEISKEIGLDISSTQIYINALESKL